MPLQSKERKRTVSRAADRTVITSVTSALHFLMITGGVAMFLSDDLGVAERIQYV